MDMNNKMRTRDDNCDTANDLICNVKGFKHFMLCGVCVNSPVDSFYVLGEGEHLTGYTQTFMLPSEDKSRWEIRDSFTNELWAHTKNLSEFPIGRRSWYFEAAGGLSECENTSRELLMHLSVEQPGNFCCGDGVCISSELVCDNNQHCNDRSFTLTPTSKLKMSSTLMDFLNLFCFQE